MLSYKKTNKLHIVSNQCCICQKSDRTKHFKQHMDHSLMLCRKCSLVFISDIPHELDGFIEEASVVSTDNKDLEFWSFPALYEKHKSIFEYYFKERYERLCLYSVPEGDFLDIGAGYGFWMKFLSEKGHTCFGIDISKKAVVYCTDQMMLNVLHSSLEDYSSDKKFAAIFMFDVLEHLERPDIALDKVKKMLLPDGVIYIQVPNVIGIKIPYGHSLGLPYHLWQFNPKSLKLLIRKSKLDKNLRYWTGIQGVIGEHERGGPSFIKKKIWEIANFIKIGNRVQLIGQNAK